MQKCKWIIRETGLHCGRPANAPVYSVAYDGYDIELFKRTGKIVKMFHPAEVIDYLCLQHAKDFDLLRLTADALPTTLLARN